MSDDKIEMLKLALDVALKFYAPLLPGDSRAVPDWFVACSSVQCGIPDSDGGIKTCLEEALALPDPPTFDVHLKHTFTDAERGVASC